MFFIMGMNSGRKDLKFSQMIICDQCGQYGRLSVFYTCTVLSLFFIPILKWNKKYYVQAECCGALYQLDAQIGRQIERGVDLEITMADLTLIRGRGQEYGASFDEQFGQGYGNAGPDYRQVKVCRQCGYSTDEDFGFCPKCGEKF